MVWAVSIAVGNGGKLGQSRASGGPKAIFGHAYSVPLFRTTRVQAAWHFLVVSNDK